VISFVRPAAVASYSVAGRFITLESSDTEASELFREFFSGWHVSLLPSFVRPRPDAIIRVFSDALAADVLNPSEEFEIASGGRCLVDATVHQLEVGGAVVRLLTGEPQIVEVFLAPDGTRRPAALASVVFHAASGAFRRCGLYELHGGGVVEPESEAGVLILGPSGAGKSTLTLQLAAAGWRYLSDDTLLLYETESQAVVRGLRKVFAVTEPTIEAAGGLNLEAHAKGPVPFDPHKRRFDPAAVFEGGFAETCRPRLLLFPRVSGGERSLTRKLSRAETMTNLLRLCPWACYDRSSARGHLRALSRLAAQAAAYELDAGRELLAGPEVAARFVASHLPES
jgi:hypothetical protein